ncbi:hypothetical protein SAMN00120144_4322 [Hymenobacter roseosalivarius DSM 11622]|uniref:Uncharacterized protein n=1 Tax=Hymenobacter roseosalivarius DSM 11622 TaxID=645990 RepID=A0A1W1W4Y2_9BACT|nr:hypothetical protein [Hymenobacter roseosalivarius]SMC00655.1 hypothetical protein SAMN00120144_4322 [Hymenobacter roseosalivarius DSM 11622]
MSRYPNYPTTCEGVQRLELTYLRRMGLLQPGLHSRTLHWSNRGERTGSIGIEAHIRPEQDSYLRLHYTINSERKYDYLVPLEAVPGNLPGAGGYRWYMRCPKTDRRATVLYLRTGTGIFAHRQAFPQQRLYYDTQLENKRFRGLAKYYAVDRIWEEQYRKGRKTHYQGKPTKWYAKLLRLEQQTAAGAPAMFQRVLDGMR